MNAFVISIDEHRFCRTQQEFIDTGINIIKFKGQTGEQIISNPYFKDRIWNLARYFSPNKTIGILGTHILLSKYLLEQNYFNNNNWVLILEDDVKVNDKLTLLSDIKQIILTKSNENLDIIKLHCIFNCDNTSNILSGSAAAYLLSKKGANKIIKFNISYPGHIDWAFNSKHMNVYNYNRINTYDKQTPFAISSTNDPGFWLQQPFIRILNYDISGIMAISFYVIILLFINLKKKT